MYIFLVAATVPKSVIINFGDSDRFVASLITNLSQFTQTPVYVIYLAVDGGRAIIFIQRSLKIERKDELKGESGE